MLPTTRRGLSGLSALLGIRPASTVASATSTSSPSTPPATTVTAHEAGIEPAWDALTDPLTVVRELQWIQDTLRYLLVVRLRDRSGSDPLAGGPLTHAEASEFSQCDG